MTIAGLVRKLELPAGIHLIVDIWEQNFVEFHRVVRSPSAFGGFKSPHIRHEMAVHACRDTMWYASARANPRTHLPKFYKFIDRSWRRNFTDQMTSELRASLEGRAAAFLQAAEASHLKWNATTWTHALHLFGVLTDEKRGAWFAVELLDILGYRPRLEERAAGDAAVVEPSTGTRTVAPSPSQFAMPADTVDRHLQQLLRVRHADGELATQVRTPSPSPSRLLSPSPSASLFPSPFPYRCMDGSCTHRWQSLS